MKPKAYLALRYTLTKRVEAFAAGWEALGYEVICGIPSTQQVGATFTCWNRIGKADEIARRWRNDSVIVAENSAWGNDFASGQWHSIARGFHNMAGTFPVGDPDRWDSLCHRLEPFRTSGETVVLPQRGIGPAEVAMPRGWTARGRVRRHPGNNKAIPLAEDLRHAGRVVTWGSGAAIRALMWGIPVESHMPNWIAEQDNTEAGRLAMFRRLAWAQWQLSEIATGEPFRRLLSDRQTC